MKKISNRLISLVIIPVLMMTITLSSAFVEPVFAVSAPAAKGTVSSYDGAYVRKSYSASSSKIRLLGEGSTFKINYEKFVTKTSTALKNIWYYTPDYKGYVRADLVKRTYNTAVEGKINANGVNIRKGAGTGFTKSYSWNKGKKVNVIMAAYSSGGAKWYKIKYGTRYYYVSAMYVTLTEGAATETVPPSTPSIPDSITAPAGKGVIFDDGGAYVRKSYSTASAKIKLLSKGDSFKINFEKFVSGTGTSLKDRWYYTPDYSGFVRCDLVTRTYGTAKKGTVNVTSASVRKGAGPSFTKVYTWNKGKTVNVVMEAYSSTGTKWYKIKDGTSYYYIYAKYITLDSGTSDSGQTTEPETVIDTGITTADVNYRIGPGTVFEKQGTLAKGTKVDIYKKEKDTNGVIWYKIKVSNSYYYVISKYVRLENGGSSEAPSDPEYPIKGWVNDNDVNVRTGAGTSYAIKTSFSYGKEVSIVGTQKDTSGNMWYAISYSGGTYYISAEYVSTTELDNVTESPNVSSEEFKAMLSQFPDSYKAGLTALHEAHPSWRFSAKKVGISWSSALSKQCSNYKANLTTFGGAYRKVAKGTYDFDNHQFIGLDGPYWVAASDKAVAYYMDPRNWLTESGIFMFESMCYDENTQKESVVKSILSKSAVPSSKSSVYMQAGKTYNINPIYLASKTYLELGKSDYMINGKYNGCYNVFNIGAVDSPDGSAARKGLDYAKSMGWTTLDKAILGGAKYIAGNFIGNNQYTQYYERFNVLNGYSSIGTHQYATAIHNAATLSSVTQSNYRDYNMLTTGFSFEIPVYDSMPDNTCKAPSELKSNNNYLDSLKVTVNGKTVAFTESFSRFKQSYVLSSTVGRSVEQVTVTAKTNDDTATVTVKGNTELNTGTNLISVTVKSSSLLYRTYKISITKE